MQTSWRVSEGQKYALTSDEDHSDFWGLAFEAEGLFTPLPKEQGARRVHLAGCLPQGGLLKSVDHVGTLLGAKSLVRALSWAFAGPA